MQLLVVFGDPDYLTIFQFGLITQGRCHALQGQVTDVLGQFRAVHDYADFGVP
ncbi:hypothetical protein D3C84_1272210 [compost metagenome]